MRRVELSFIILMMIETLEYKAREFFVMCLRLYCGRKR
jgi:hypothetical protein